MTIISINGGHSGAVAIVTDKRGDLEYYSFQAERFDRVKCSNGCRRYAGDDFSSETIRELINEESSLDDLVDHALSQAKVSIDEIDKVVLNEWTELYRLPDWVSEKEIKYVRHHLAHAALSFYTSKTDEALIVVCDGNGDKFEAGYEIQSLWKGNGEGIVELATTYKSDYYEMGIGNAYELYSYWLGFGYNGCGTTMALASHAIYASDEWKKIFSFQNGHIQVSKEYIDINAHVEEQNYEKQGSSLFNNDHAAMLRQMKLPNNYRIREREGYPLYPMYIDMANDIQRAVEDSVLRYIDYGLNMYSTKNVCAGGGVFLNCNLNSLVKESFELEEYHVPTSPDDGGVALGGALLYYYKSAYKNKSFSPYLGTEMMVPALNSGRIKKVECDNVFKFAAKKISEGKLVAWCQGRAEFGPRALGHRSLLADPRDINIPRKINSRIKHRASFRPFAPSVKKESYTTFFEGNIPIHFMLETRQIKKEYRNLIPAVNHIDNSARVQVVDRKVAPRYYQLIEEFEKLTGIGIVLNTSLNRAGEPIVDSSEDALKLLDKGLVDYLIINDTVYENGEYDEL